MNRSDTLCRPFRPRFFSLHVTTRLRAWLLTPGASRLECAPSRSKHKVPNHFQASLEEVRSSRPDLLVTESCDTWERRPEGPPVSRPGRKAGIVNGRNLERRRCGTGIMRAASDAPTFSQLERPAAATRRRAARGGYPCVSSGLLPLRY
jgi:hypothetical protein